MQAATPERATPKRATYEQWDMINNGLKALNHNDSHDGNHDKTREFWVMHREIFSILPNRVPAMSFTSTEMQKYKNMKRILPILRRRYEEVYMMTANGDPIPAKLIAAPAKPDALWSIQLEQQAETGETRTVPRDNLLY